MMLCMEICEELRYNFGVGSNRQSRFVKIIGSESSVSFTMWI